MREYRSQGEEEEEEEEEEEGLKVGIFGYNHMKHTNDVDHPFDASTTFHICIETEYPHVPTNRIEESQYTNIHRGI